MTSPHPPSSLGSSVYTLYLRWSLLHVRWSTLSGWSLVSLSFGKEQVLPIANICDFSRRERRAIEAFEKRSSGGGGVGETLFHQKSKNVCQRHSLSHSTVFYHNHLISSRGQIFKVGTIRGWFNLKRETDKNHQVSLVQIWNYYQTRLVPDSLDFFQILYCRVLNMAPLPSKDNT